MTLLEDMLKVAIHATSKVNKYCAEVLSNCLLIPKPKFKVGDVLKPKEYHAQTVRMVHYSYGSKSWFYLLSDIDIIWFPEDELELVEEVK